MPNNEISYDMGNGSWGWGRDERGIYAVGSGVARTFGYRDAANAIRSLDAEDHGTRETSTMDRDGRKVPREVIVIYEDGLLELAFLSRRPEAKALKKRIKEVLRKIREDGFYISDEITPQQLLRLDERSHYLNLREIMKESIDYTPSGEGVGDFFKMMENRFHIQVTGMTAQELRDNRPINMAIVPPNQLTKKGEPNYDGRKSGLNRYYDSEVERRSATNMIVIGMLKLRMAEFKNGYRMKDVIDSVNWALNQASSASGNR